MRKFLHCAVYFFFLCSAPALYAQETSWDDYGLTKEKPILVGGEDLRQGPVYQRAYLNKLTGPNGEKISYQRTGSCCEFETPNGILGGGMLDMYKVTYDGLDEPVVLYFNMYDPNPDEIRAPKGFRLNRNE